jgi:response regulator NasT
MKAKARILVVDDDRLVLATVTHGLAQAGFEVIDADNGDEAILLAREQRPDLALLDIRMEGMSGFDVAATLRDVYRIPFMFLSAFSDPATLAQVQALGALDYLIKPLDVGQIVPSVEAALERSRSSSSSSSRSSVLPGGEQSAAPGMSPTQADPAAAAAERASPLADPVALAVGVLMHRYSLTRERAFEHLQRLAKDQPEGLRAQADQLLGAIEVLARSAP